jgi:hypothetical protein
MASFTNRTPYRNQINSSLTDEDFELLRLAVHESKKYQAQLIREIIKDYLATKVATPAA